MDKGHKQATYKRMTIQDQFTSEKIWIVKDIQINTTIKYFLPIIMSNI